jgi:hypothetical protein
VSWLCCYTLRIPRDGKTGGGQLEIWIKHFDFIVSTIYILLSHINEFLIKKISVCKGIIFSVRLSHCDCSPLAPKCATVSCRLFPSGTQTGMAYLPTYLLINGAESFLRS